MHPLIGITTYEKSERNRFELPATYVEAVRLAGGIPVLVAPGELHLELLLDRLDGLLLAGGDDVAPSYYGGADHPKIHNISHERDKMEIALSRLVVEREMPALCICRGIQVLNVALGGTLIEHIPDEPGETLEHRSRYDAGEAHSHDIEITPGSRLAQVLESETLHLDSFHHQAIRLPAPTLRVVATSPDGIIEAVEHPEHPFLLGVQWHPEREAPNIPGQLRLFQAFVEECRVYAMSRSR